MMPVNQGIGYDMNYPLSSAGYMLENPEVNPQNFVNMQNNNNNFNFPNNYNLNKNLPLGNNMNNVNPNNMPMNIGLNPNMNMYYNGNNFNAVNNVNLYDQGEDSISNFSINSNKKSLKKDNKNIKK